MTMRGHAADVPGPWMRVCSGVREQVGYKNASVHQNALKIEEVLRQKIDLTIIRITRIEISFSLFRMHKKLMD